MHYDVFYNDLELQRTFWKQRLKRMHSDTIWNCRENFENNVLKACIL